VSELKFEGRERHVDTLPARQPASQPASQPAKPLVIAHGRQCSCIHGGWNPTIARCMSILVDVQCPDMATETSGTSEPRVQTLREESHAARENERLACFPASIPR